jgi:AICAR transformylase/IMP cyclohydrolase PurH
MGDEIIIKKKYRKICDLKYGMNPHQNATLYCPIDSEFPIDILNGSPGFINFMDAINSWRLVNELYETLKTYLIDYPVVASFKHVTPAGVGVGVPFDHELIGTDKFKNFFMVSGDNENGLNCNSCAFLRARYSDPLSSFGDFLAFSNEVDVNVARLIKKEVSDGIIAPSYTEEALNILKEKKSGKYIILKGHYRNRKENKKEIELRDYGNGLVLAQEISNMINYDFNKDKLDIKDLINVIIANVTVKYTQSNSIVIANNFQTLGIGSGQQNRVDCVRIAGEKSKKWYMRWHSDISKLNFSGMTRTDKINCIYDYITKNDISENEDENEDEDANLVLASDGFFPFSDSIELANKYGVKIIIQPGGSIEDENVKKTCEKYRIKMIITNNRLFHH